MGGSVPHMRVVRTRLELVWHPVSPYHTHVTPVSRWSALVPHSHHHPFPHRATDTSGDARCRLPCADDPRVEWSSSEQRNGYDRRARMPVTPLTNNDQPQFLLLLSSHGRMRCLCLVEKHPSPCGSSPSFSTFQRPLRAFHEKTLWWQEREDTSL
jgi:hypothetical protein